MLRHRNPLRITPSAVLAAAAVALAAAAGMAQAPAGWRTYTNVRFQYTVCYPDGLVPQGEADNSDGQKFLAADGAELIVYGRNNVLNEPLRDVLAAIGSRLAGASGEVTYKVLKPDWFVVSGRNGATVFYAKTLSSHGQFKSFELTYAASAAAVYDPVIGRLAACFADLAR
jgi:hypothetical protein